MLTHIALGRGSAIVGSTASIYAVLNLNDAEDLNLVEQTMTVVDDTDGSNTAMVGTLLSSSIILLIIWNHILCFRQWRHL